MTGRADPDGRPRHGHTNHSTLVGARAAAVSAHNMCHSYMRQVVDTTSLRPGPPAPPQCREWRRSLVSLSHEPPTSDLHASQAAIHTHAPQPPISSLGSVRCPPTRLPHGQRERATRSAHTRHTPHAPSPNGHGALSRSPRAKPQGLQRRFPRRRGSHAAAVARRDTPSREVPTAPGQEVGGPS